MGFFVISVVVRFALVAVKVQHWTVGFFDGEGLTNEAFFRKCSCMFLKTTTLLLPSNHTDGNPPVTLPGCLSVGSQRRQVLLFTISVIKRDLASLI